MSRTQHAEHFVNKFASRPLVSEFVFLSPEFRKGAHTKEVCDLLLILRRRALLIQMKCQEDPTSRTGDELRKWVLKQAEEALNQVEGTVKTTLEREFWCEHPRRGRVEFQKGEITPIHGLVLVEHFSEAISLPGFALEYKGVPISYFTVNDFLNVVNELRSFPEIERYLLARRTLPAEFLRSVGGEREVFEYYLLNETFIESLEDMRTSVKRDPQRLISAIQAKEEGDVYASYIEYIADVLSKRSASYRDGLTEEQISHFLETGERRAYLVMQEELCDLPYPARRDLGRRFRGASDTIKGEEGTVAMRYMAAFHDAKPDFVYVYVAARGVERAELIARGQLLLMAALSWYQKTEGIVIIDRDGVSYDVLLIRDFSPSELNVAQGKEFFGSLKTNDHVGSLVPKRSDAR